jgi:hypothetical protein
MQRKVLPGILSFQGILGFALPPFAGSCEQEAVTRDEPISLIEVWTKHWRSNDMHRTIKLAALVFSFLLMASVGGCFAAAVQKDANNAATKNSPNSNTATKAQNTEHMNKASAKRGSDVLAKPETLKGTISFIGSSDKEVTLTGADGTPYDFRVTSKTKVDLSGKRIETTQLPNEEHKEATVRFVPTANGNVAKNLNISAS